MRNEILNCEAEIMEFFGVKTFPFSTSVGIDHILITDVAKSIQMKMALAVSGRQFCVLTGQPGTGKSTLLRHFATKVLDHDCTDVIYIAESSLTPRRLYAYALRALGLEPKFYRGDSKHLLHEKIKGLTSRAGHRVCLILDEAHLLCKETAQEVRFLLNYAYDEQSLVSLILSGQDELWDILKRPENQAISQRIDYVGRTAPLSEDECRQYIDLRLSDADYRGPKLWTEDGLQRIIELSGGCMRRINKLCSHAMLYCALRKKLPADGALIDLIAGQELPNL